MSGGSELLDGFNWVLLRGLYLRMEGSTDNLGLAGLVRASPKDLVILPGVCLVSLLSGWQENGISYHPQQLISLCLASNFSAVATENAQVKYSACKSQPWATGCSCTLSVHLHKLLKYFSDTLLGNSAINGQLPEWHGIFCVVLPYVL